MSFDAYVSWSDDNNDVEKGNRSSSNNNKNNNLDGVGKQAWNKQFRSFRIMATPFFRENPASTCSLVILCVLAILNSLVSVLFSYLGNFFWTALSDKDEERFYEILQWFVVALLLLAPINVIYRYQRQKLAIAWREWLTQRTMKLYTSSRVYYQLEFLLENRDSIDNPDQRISEDIRSFAEFSLSFFLIVLNSTLDLVCFSIILFLIRPQLFLAIVGFASVGTLATWLIGKQLIVLNFEKLKKEADFRFSLVRIRENAESIAFYAGEHIEIKAVTRRFQRVIGNMHQVNVAQRNLDLFTTLYSYLVWVVPLIVVAPEYFAGNVALGVVQQSAVAFSHVLSDLSLIINQFDSLSEFAAGIDRLFQFFNAVKSADGDRDEESPLLAKQEAIPVGGANAVSQSTGSTIELRKVQPSLLTRQDDNANGSAAVSLRNVTLYTPDFKRTLIHNLTFSLPWGRRVLITGNSGVGKSSLLRAIAGLWTAGYGSVERPTNDCVCFLPQRPYCALGSLRDQLLYPHGLEDHVDTDKEESYNFATDRQRVSDPELVDILKAVDLTNVATRAGNGDSTRGLDAVLDWSNTLSLGEQQRLAFGRILSNKPKLVFLDESTSALDVESERKMYALLKSLDQGRLTYISVGHRPSLEEHHDIKLILNGEENYSVETIK